MIPLREIKRVDYPVLLKERLDAFGVLLHVAVSTEGHEVVARSTRTTGLHVGRVARSILATSMTGQGTDPLRLRAELFLPALSFG